jgi:hypothetical protein
VLLWALSSMRPPVLVLPNLQIDEGKTALILAFITGNIAIVGHISLLCIALPITPSL